MHALDFLGNLLGVLRFEVRKALFFQDEAFAQDFGRSQLLSIHRAVTLVHAEVAARLVRAEEVAQGVGHLRRRSPSGSLW